MARRAVLLLLGIAGGLLLAGSARAYTNAGPISEEIQNLFWAITLFAVVVAAVVFGILAVFLVRYRESVSPRPTSWVEGDRNLEILWTVIPTIILIVIVIISVPVLVYTDTIPPPDTTVRVVGTQFIWTFYYEDGTTSSPDLWIQAGTVVKLEVTATDVVHSFAVPDLGIKIDAFPGHMNHWWMQGDVPGDYLIQCAELCGLEHAKMLASVEVLSEDEFDAWLTRRRAEQTAGTSDLGQETWEGVCSKCHGLSGEGGIGPALAGSVVIADPEAVEDLVRNGRRTMPAVGAGWTSEQVTALTNYLRENPPGGG